MVRATYHSLQEQTPEGVEEIMGSAATKPNGISTMEVDLEESARDQPSLEEDGEPMYGRSQQVDVSAFDKDDHLLDDDAKVPFSWRKLLAFSGPGILMSIAYLDPGNIESDLQTGARAEYELIWVLFWCTVLGFLLQSMAARLGVTTGKHLADHCREILPRAPRITLWIMTEIAIIGSDIQEVIGSAIAINLLSNGTVPYWGGVLITAADTFTFLFLENYGIRYLEGVFGVLVGAMAITFGYLYGVSSPPSGDVIEGLIVPRISRSTSDIAVGIVGAVIMPHNIYLHSALVLSRKINRAKAPRIREANFYNYVESAGALLISFVINLFVMGVFAYSFHDKPDNVGECGDDIYDQSCCYGDDIGLLNAGECFKFFNKGDTSHNALKIIWGIGILAAGQSSTMTGTYSGQVVMQGFMRLNIKPWQRVFITRSIAIVPTMILATIFAGDSQLLDVVNLWLNIIQSLQLPFALVPVLVLTSREDIMGRFRNGVKLNYLTGMFGFMVIVINIYLVVDQVAQISLPWYVVILVCICALCYLGFIGYLALGEEKFVSYWNRFVTCCPLQLSAGPGKRLLDSGSGGWKDSSVQGPYEYSAIGKSLAKPEHSEPDAAGESESAAGNGDRKPLLPPS